ncbi:cyanophycinase [Stenotrophomonas sp. CPCC 101365]|uniref:Cyanophycinase n=2 Tax=Stenotrophomonas mori TaxID=2871096 RepID=A0ABT0SIQ9_9GAMM|nr:cyanophycinase [Stenotrophomonas mori]MCL7715218.1 cyanophycinase [Stenotrophomonas mori]
MAATAAADGGRRAPEQGYRYYDVGDLEAPRPGRTEPALLLMGGGDWVPEAMHWWVERAGHGRVVILRASGDDALQKELYEDIGGVTAVQTLVFDSRTAADDPRVLRIVQEADAIFLAGGDQARYVRFWKGTALNRALDAHVAAGKPIGGTSAGLAILGRYSYGAMDGGSVDSRTALSDPTGSEVTMETDFLTMPHLSRVVTDTHFAKRERLGRLIAFVARAAADGGRDDIVGLGVDEDSVLCVEADGRGRVLSLVDGHAWLVMPGHAPERLRSGEPLSFRDIPVIGVGAGSRLQLDGFKVESPAFTAVANVVDGELHLRPE